MKRIIGGRTYDTGTSLEVARVEGVRENDDPIRPGAEWRESLYRTRGGAFFFVDSENFSRKNRAGEWESAQRTEVEPMTREQAQHWVETRDGVEILMEGQLAEPPEAEAEDEASESVAAVMVRMPASLKAVIAQRAAAEGVSLSIWAQRCLESCARRG